MDGGILFLGFFTFFFFLTGRPVPCCAYVVVKKRLKKKTRKKKNPPVPHYMRLTLLLLLSLLTLSISTSIPMPRSRSRAPKTPRSSSKPPTRSNVEGVKIIKEKRKNPAIEIVERGGYEVKIKDRAVSFREGGCRGRREGCGFFLFVVCCFFFSFDFIYIYINIPPTKPYPHHHLTKDNYHVNQRDGIKIYSFFELFF